MPVWSFFDGFSDELFSNYLVVAKTIAEYQEVMMEFIKEHSILSKLRDMSDFTKAHSVVLHFCKKCYTLGLHF